MVNIEPYKETLAQKFSADVLPYELGVLLHQLGYWEEATRSYEEALVINPDSIEIYLQLGKLWQDRGRLELAIAVYQRALSRKANDPRIYSYLGYSLIQKKAFQEATEIYEKALEIDPNSALLYNNLGRSFLGQNKINKAQKAFDKSLELDPNLGSVYYNLGSLWEKIGDYQQATTYYQQAIALEPDNLRAYSNCINMFMQQNQFSQAIDYLRQTLIKQPIFIEAYCQRLPQFKEDDLFDQARLLCISFLRALNSSSELSDLLNKLAQLYQAFADIFTFAFEHKRAEIYYQKAIQNKPENIDLYWHLGNCLVKQERLETAIIIYQLGLTLDPNHIPLRFAVGNVLVKQKRFQEALVYYEQVIEYPSAIPLQSLLSSPFSQQLPQHPKGIYELTQDWVKQTHLKGCHYREIEPNNFPASQRVEENPKIVSPSSTYPACQGINCVPCIRELCNQFEPIAIARGVYSISFPQNSLYLENFPNFVVKIPKGRFWVIPKKRFWLPCKAMAVITPDHYLLRDLSRDYPWYLPGCKHQNSSLHNLFRTEVLPPFEKIKGTVAILSALSGHIYYHWMIDVLPRINLLRRSGIKWHQIDNFVINTVESPFQKETLASLEIPPEKIISSDEHPYLEADQLIVPSFPSYPHWATQDSIFFLRENFLTNLSSTSSESPKYLYISRGQSNYRQIINETEVIEVLEEFNFVTVHLEEYSVQTQVKLFQGARVIVAAHGSCLTNLVFARPHTQIIEIFSPNYIRPDFWTISQQLGLKHYYIIGNSFDCVPLLKLMYQSPLTEDILVDINTLRLALEIVFDHSL